MRLSDSKPYRFPHDKFWDIYRNAFQFELSITLFTNVIPQKLKIMARSSNLWRFIYAFQSVNAILLTWSEKVEKEGPIISPSISDFVYDVYCLKKLVLIHDDTRCKWTLSTSDSHYFLVYFPTTFKSNIAMRAKFNFHTQLFKRIIQFSRAQIGSGEILRTLPLLKP